MNRKALSPVISTLILSAAVIAIGGGLWSYAMGASTLIAEDYVNDTLELANEITERFVVEHVCYVSILDKLNVTVYNYGNQKIIVDVYATIENSTKVYIDSEHGFEIQKGEARGILVDVTWGPLVSGDKVSIKIQSRRQNVAYKKYYVP